MKTITFKVSDDEEGHLRDEARKAGLTVSDFLRRKIRGPEAISLVRSRATGAPAFSSGGSGAPITTEMVKAMLADFP